VGEMMMKYYSEWVKSSSEITLVPPNSSDNHGNKKLCILSQVCDKVSRSLLMSLIKLDFTSFYFITLGRVFSFFTRSGY
jgi:hypothetical protein